MPMEVVKETEGISNFKDSRHHMWIQAIRDLKKAWLEMQYFITKEEVDWIIKDCPSQWKLRVTIYIKKTFMTQSSKPKDKYE
jgi:hypothetical protein